MKSILISLFNKEESIWVTYLEKYLPGYKVYRAEIDAYDPEMIDYAVVWKPKEHFFEGLRNLKVVFNTGAGVDNLMKFSQLSEVPIIRIVPEGLKDSMLQYILFNVLYYHRNMYVLEEAQKQRNWIALQEPKAEDLNIGILGLGFIGSEIASFLGTMKYNVLGWSRTKKAIKGIATFSGKTGLKNMVKKSDILISLLPLTQETKGLVNRDLLEDLPKNNFFKGAFFISCGRGGVQKDNDILWALNNGVLKGATLDVFQNEPLPKKSPLWSHQKIRITPHLAALNNPEDSCRLIMRQIMKVEKGEKLNNIVDFRKGY